MSDTEFDVGAFYRAVQGRRIREGLSWRELARRLSLSSSTFTRLSQGRRPDVDTFLRIIRWLGAPAEAFVRVGGSGDSSTATLETALAVLRQDSSIGEEDRAALEEIVRVAYNRFRTTSS